MTVRILILVVCFALGYWLVMKFMNLSVSKARDDSAADERVTLSNWFEILEVPEDSSREQINAAFKKKIAQYHPDKVAMMGPEIRAVAEAKSKQINAAYELGMRRRG